MNYFYSFDLVSKCLVAVFIFMYCLVFSVSYFVLLHSLVLGVIFGWVTPPIIFFKVGSRFQARVKEEYPFFYILFSVSLSYFQSSVSIFIFRSYISVFLIRLIFWFNLQYDFCSSLLSHSSSYFLFFIKKIAGGKVFFVG